jgi:glycosyltransferase involved in cell wall biosynthesis
MNTDGGAVLDIVHVVRSDSFSGVERYVCDVASALAERGHRLRVIGGDPERMRRELHQHGEHVPAVSVAEAARALKKIGRVDLVHAHMTAGEAAAVLTRPWHRAPVIVTRHFAARRGRSLVGRLAAPAIASVVAEQISISHFVAGSIGERTVVLPNGVPTRPPSPLSSRRVLMMQLFEPEKDGETGLRAWAEGALADQGWTMELAGTGTLEGEMRRLCDGLGVTESVRFLGRVGDTNELLSATSIFLATAPREPFGLAVAEAMSYGIPVVAAAGGGHLETLGGEGCFFAPGDAVSAASELRRLATDYPYMRSVGKRVRARQQRLFSLEGHVDKLERLYRGTVQ